MTKTSESGYLSVKMYRSSDSKGRTVMVVLKNGEETKNTLQANVILPCHYRYNPAMAGGYGQNQKT
jgi:hypothetical protein